MTAYISLGASDSTNKGIIDFRMDNSLFFDRGNLIGKNQIENGNHIRSTIGLKHNPVSASVSSYPENKFRIDSEGLQIEDERTNLCQNSSFTGGLINGVFLAGSPSGVSVTTEFGTEFGLPYLQVNSSGTSTNSGPLRLAFTSGIPVTVGQTYTTSAFIRLISGSFPSQPMFRYRFNNSSNSLTTEFSGSSLATSINSSFKRFSQTHVANDPAAAFIQPQFVISETTGNSWNFSYRIYCPQIELSEYAGSPVLTTNSGLTYNKDTFKVLTNLDGSSGTVMMSARIHGTTTQELANCLVIGNDTMTNYIRIGYSRSRQRFFAETCKNSVKITLYYNSVDVRNNFHSFGFTWSNGTIRTVIGTEFLDFTFPAITTGPMTLGILSGTDRSSPVSGVVDRVVVYPFQISNTDFTNLANSIKSSGKPIQVERYGTVSPKTVPTWMNNFQFAADFTSDTVILNRHLTNIEELDTRFHTRTGTETRYAENSNGSVSSFLSGKMAIIDRGYDSREQWVNLLGSPIGTSGMAASRGTIQGGFPGPVSNDAVLFTCDGNSDPIMNRQLNSSPSGKTYTFSVWMRVENSNGHPLKARLWAYGTTGIEAVRDISLDITTSWKKYSWTTTFPSGMTSAASIWRIDPFDASSGGLNQPLSGSSIITDGWQVTETPYTMPFGVGTIARDSLVIPSEEIGVAINPSLENKTLVIAWKGRDYRSGSSFPRLMEAQAAIANNRMTLFRRSSDGLLGATFASNSSTENDISTLAQSPYGSDNTIVVVWRSDGTIYAKSSNSATITASGRPAISYPLSAIGVGIAPPSNASSSAINAEIKLCSFGVFDVFTDTDALNLFNTISGI